MVARTLPVKVNPVKLSSQDSAVQAVRKRKVKTDRLTKYFAEKGLTVQDLPKAIICHELMGMFMLALTWSSCYYFPPSQNRFLKEPIAKMLAMVPKSLSGPVTSNPFLSSRIGTSYLESSCLRKLIRPITLPSKLFLTYKLVQALPKFDLPGLQSTSQPTPLVDEIATDDSCKRRMEAKASINSIRGGASLGESVQFNSYAEGQGFETSFGVSQIGDEFGFDRLSSAVGKLTPHYVSLRGLKSDAQS